MRNLIASGFAGLLAVLLAQTAFGVSLPFHDAFDYAEGNLNAVATPTWATGNGGSTFEIAVSNSAALLAPAGFPAASGKGVRRSPSGTARRSVLTFPAIANTDGNVVYVSFLIEVPAAPSSAQIVLHIDTSSGSVTTPDMAFFVEAGPKIGIGKNASAPGFTMATNLGPGVHLVVGRYTFQAGNDMAELWIDPPASDYGAGSAPPALGSHVNSGDPTAIGFCQIITASGASSSVIHIDEYRIGSTWAEVVPSSGPVIGEKLGFTTPPASAQVNTTMSPVVVQVQNAGGASAASNGVPVTLALTGGSGTLSGTLTQNTDATGKATFGNLSIDALGNDKQLTATASGIGAGLTAAVSGTFAITSEPVVSGLMITQAMLLPVGFKVAGSTEQPGVFTQILGSSDVGREQTNWLIVSYQNAAAGGEVTFTNPVSPALPNVFYRLRTGNDVTKLEPPSIGVPPASQIVSPGATAAFSVTAAGPQLQYLWFFNGNPIPGATNSSLVIPGAQPGNIGNYYVAVANPAGNVNSPIATLGVGNIGPTITSEPQDQTVNAGGTAIFHVAATGTSPLGYQWYLNTNAPIAAATTATLTLTGVTTNDNGNKYRVIVSNGFGGDTSADASLTVNAVPTDLPDTNLVGWAAYAGVTGGAGGAETVVTTYAQLRAAVRAAGPLIIRVQGQLVANEDYCYVEGYDKTIVGEGTDAALYGAGLRIGATNIIIANLLISATNHSQADGVTMDNSSHGTGRNVWVDHCTFYDCRDGSVDVTKGANYATVSWCKFYYAPVPDGVVNHEFVNLIASSDSDNPNNTLYRVTFHHNWYGEYCRERMPSVRFGRVHVFNNYYDCVGNNYCVRTRLDSEVLVENNYFLGVQNPWEKFTATRANGRLKATGNVTNNCTFVNGWTSGAVVIPGNDALGSELDPPPYTQSPFYYPPLTPASDVPYYVQTYAGRGKYPYVP